MTKRFNKGQQLLANAKFTEAEKLIQEIKKSDPSAPESFILDIEKNINVGLIQQSNGQDASSAFARALTLSQNFNRIFDHDSRGFSYLGYTQFLNSFNKEGTESLLKAIQLDPDNAQPYYLLWMFSGTASQEHLEDTLIQKALQINPNYQDAISALANENKQVKNFKTAIKLLEKHVAIAPTFLGYYQLSLAYVETQKYDLAGEYAEKSIELYDGYSWSHYLLGISKAITGDAVIATKELRRAISQNPQCTEQLRQLSKILPEINRLDLGLTNTEPNTDDENGYPKFYMEGVQLAQKRYYAYAIQKLSACRELENSKSEPRLAFISSILNWEAHCFRELGYYPEAIDVIEKSLNLTISEGLQQDIASLYANLAVIYHRWGDYEKALENHFSSLRELEKQDLQNYIAYAYNNIAELYREQKQYDSSAYYAEKAFDLNTDIEAADQLPINIKSIALAYAYQGKYEYGLQLIEQGLEMTEGKEEYANQHKTLLMAKAELLFLDNQFKESRREFDSVLPFIKSGTDIYHPEYLKYAKLDTWIAQAIGTASAINQRYDTLLSNILIQIDHVFPVLSDAGRTHLYRTVKNDIEAYYSYVINQNTPSEESLKNIFDLRVRTKGILLSSTQQARHQIITSKNDSLIHQYRHWQAQRNLLARALQMSPAERKLANLSLDELENNVDDLERKISRSSRSFDRTRRNHVDLKTLSKHLKKDQAFVEIIRVRTFHPEHQATFDESSVSYAVLILKGGNSVPTLTLLKNGTELEGRYYDFYLNNIKSKNLEDTSYNQYWKPLENQLEGIKDVFISLDGIYNKINLNTLKNSQTGKFILDEINLHYISSAQELINNHQSLEPNRSNSVLIGYPDFELSSEKSQIIAENIQNEYLNFLDHSIVMRSSGTTIQPLPGTLVEIEKLEKQFKTSFLPVDVFVADQAIEERLKSTESPRILHIATHGFFESSNHETNPLFSSGLLLAGAGVTHDQSDEGDDGIFTAFEAMNMNLEGTELVTLSACETGLGDIKNGEGVYGLQRAFIIAGAQSLIMSLWKVNDNATQELMTRFYELYLGGQKIDTAFRNAQLDLKKQYPEPYFWGAFVLIE